MGMGNMGENIYRCNGQIITFAEDDDEFGCLCVKRFDAPLGVETVRSLALLGAAARMAWDREMMGVSEDWMSIPHCIPAAVLDAVRRIKLEGE